MDDTPLRGPWLILCEGQGDAAFLRHLIQKRGLPDFEIKHPKEGEAGGKSAFGQRLDALKIQPGFEKLSAVIVVSDNDDEPNSSFGEIQKQIQWAGFAVPAEPLQIARGPNLPATVVVMLPWVKQPGDLEALCLRAAYDRWPDLKRCLDAYCRCAATDSWKPGKQFKMRLRCLLSAACEFDPNTSLVYAWSDQRRGNLIPLDHPCFSQLAEFLQRFDSYLAGR